MTEQRGRGRYSDEMRERAVRMVFEAQRHCGSQWEAISSVAEKLGPTPETVRKWVRRTEVDEGRRPGLSSEERERLKRLERENRALDLAKGRIGAMPTPTGRPRIPVTATSGCTSDDDWRDAPAIKARLAGGHCLRAPAQGACPYANICEHCPSFRTDAASAAVLSAQRVDTRTLLADAQTRGWIDEADRHRRRRRVVLLNPRARADITPLLAHPRPGPPRHRRLDRHLVQQKTAPLHQNPPTRFASSRARQREPQPMRQLLVVHAHARIRHSPTQIPGHPYPPHPLGRLDRCYRRQTPVQPPQVPGPDEARVQNRRQRPRRPRRQRMRHSLEPPRPARAGN